MQNRYALRFENGERRGEVIALNGPSLSFGRRPGNAVQILDPSISGKHAELVETAEGPLLRDLGSTNGTKVGDDRVSEQVLTHGDLVVLGNVRLSFHDAQIAAPAVALEEDEDDGPVLEMAEAAASGGGGGGGEEMRTVSAESLARSGKKSRLGFWVLLLVLAGGGAGAWYALQPGSSDSAAPSRAVVAVAGNLLTDNFSFEEGAIAGGWEPLEAAPGEFYSDPTAASAGAEGLRADLGGGEWAEHVSRELDLSGVQALTASAYLMREAAADVRLGVRFSSSEGSAADCTAWSAAPGDPDDFTAVELSVPVPRSHDRARIVVRALSSAAGEELASALADDVAVVSGQAAGARIHEFRGCRIYELGQPATSELLLTKLDRALVSGLSYRAESGAGGLPQPMDIEVLEAGLSLSCASGSELVLRVEPSLTDERVVTRGSDGSRLHQVEFERTDTTHLMLGTERDLVDIRFETPVTVRGQPTNDGFDIRVVEPGRVGVQLSFKNERVAANNLAHDARQAQEAGKLGDCLASWQRLLDEFPYDDVLVQEGLEARARLIDAGLTEVRDLRAEVERARFFRLVDLFRQCRDSALDCAERYSGSEVEIAARELAKELEPEVAALESDLDELEVDRLTAILRALEAQEMERLAARVRARLEKQFGVQAAGAGSAGGK